MLPRLASKAYQPAAMTHSQSEGNIGSHSASPSSSGGSGSSYVYCGTEDELLRLSEDTTSSSAFSRGRSVHRRTPSPTKELEDIQEVQLPQTPPASPQKRSRSPMKRMFGKDGWLGKSLSMNELPNYESRRSPLKELGGRFKKGLGNLVRNNDQGT